MARLRYNGLCTGSAGALTALALGASLTNSATSITFSAALTYNNGTAVPTITGSDYIPLSILDAAGNVAEIVYLTAYTTAGTTGTITRGQEGTTGVAHAGTEAVVHGPTNHDVGTLVSKVRVTSGDISLDQTAITALTAFDLTIAASVGDELEVSFGGRFANVSQIVSFDAYTMNGGTRVNPVGAGLSASLATTCGVSAWTVSTTSSGTAQEMVGGSAMPYTVQSGDIFSGVVTLRLFYAKLNTTARTLFANANVPAELFVKNLKH